MTSIRSSGGGRASIPPTRPLIAPGDAEELVRGRHDDPFALLGPHAVDADWIVRALLPGADRADLIDAAGKLHPMDVAHPEGLFALRLPEHPGAYRLAAQANGTAWQVEDPYRFGPMMGATDEHLFAEGTHWRLWQLLGAHLREHEGSDGTAFTVWAPNARRVSVVGDFNLWDGRRHVMRRRGSTGLWEIFVPGMEAGALYKFEIQARDGTLMPLKADPVGFGAEHPPATGSVVRRIEGYAWSDAAWMAGRAERHRVDRPVSIYEVHFGSWQHGEDGQPLSYRALAERLVPYVRDMGFTHIEALPLTEHPFDGSWGYQPIGLYAPTCRYGRPEDFRAFVEACHEAGLGLILDWVPAHFPTDQHGLAHFDGTPLYEHADPREGFHRDWNTLIYNFGRTEVANFLIANALYWLREHHVDGLRVDAVASMLYRDYSREEGDWVPNRHGGRENLEAIAFLRRLNTVIYGEDPSIVTMAEESTAWPGVSKPVHDGGLGFGYKWNMGWMHDTLAYMSEDPIYRKHHHNKMSFGLLYGFSENFVLPLSHDEVVHGKGSIIDRMPGDRWQKFANLRAYYAFMFAHPGKKLLFMGQEFGQQGEWSHGHALPWASLDEGLHRGTHDLMRDLNGHYRHRPALHARDVHGDGFEWIDAGAAEASVYAWVRWGEAGDAPVLAVFNFSGAEQARWRLGVPRAGHWVEILNTDAKIYGGAGRGNMGGATTEAAESHGRPHSLVLTLPPLTALYFEWRGSEGPGT
ncbi:MAG: 1,4-alpha-glucan branching protein GlgB [Pseudomonadota bacterium]